jgi:CIC family chloride channel protein
VGGGATGAAMAAIVMIFEMTLDYTVIVPLTLTVAISYAVRKSVMSDSIYTRKLALRGTPVPETLRADLQCTRHAEGIMNVHLEILPAATRLQDLPSERDGAFVVTDESGAVVGAVTRESLPGLDHATTTAAIGDVMRPDYVVVSPGDSLWNVVAAMSSTNSSIVLVALHDGPLSAVEVQGVITRKDIMDTLAGDMELFGS